MADASFVLLKMDKGILGEGMHFDNFNQAIDFFVKDVVYDSDREYVKNEISFDTIRKRLKKEPSYSVEYRAIIGGVATWHEMVISSLSDDEIVLGYAIKDAEILNSHISKALLDNYDAIYVANLSTDQMKVLKASGIMMNKPQIVSYSKMLKEFASGLSGEAKEYFEAASDLEYEKRILKKDGKAEYAYQSPYYGEDPVWVKSEIHVLTWKDKQPETAVIGISRVDSLQQEKIELNEQLLVTTRELEEENQHNKTLNQIIKSGSWLFRFDENDVGISDEFTPECAAVLDCDVKSKEDWLNYVYSEDKDLVLKEFNSCLKDHSCKTPFDVEYRVKSRDGKYHWIHAAGRMRRNDDGTGEMYGICVDIEETVKNRAKQKEELESALSKAKEANNAKTEFLFNMSHDIRTPLNAILEFTDIAEKHIDEKEKTIDCLNKTKQSANLLLTLINSVFDMTRIESGKIEKEEKFGDVLLSFASIESIMYEEAGRKDLTLSFEYGKVTDRYVYADFTRCLRIFSNLITNAIKYSKEGGHIRVYCEQATAKKKGVALYRYIFEDDGIGMSEEFQKHMFESFTREHSTTISGIQGTGLGLSVCKSFVDYLGGTIECESELGKGTKFTVVLPFRVQEGDNYTDPVTGKILSAGDNMPMKEAISLIDKKVLLVEDNELNREIALDILKDEGLIVDDVENGQMALDVLLEKGPEYYDFVLMDIQMPVMNGYEATKKIRQMYPDNHIPIIALSANAFEEDRKASMDAGMDAHVAKPININELIDVLEKNLK